MQRTIFSNSFTQNMPADPVQTNRRRQVENACYSRVIPQKVRAPELLSFSNEMIEELGLECPANNPETKRNFTDILSGNTQVSSMDPYAMCYGGHQFGHWAGQLGDGRAINLGEIINPAGDQFTLQLKGAGPTPYSRNADGLAVMRSSIREYLCSEAMFHLGVPTTRALSLISTGELVERDMFYDGNSKDEPGAVVCRVAPSFIRFGNFEIHSARGEYDVLKKLADYTINQHFSHLGKPSNEVYAAWFHEVCMLTAKMVVDWMRVGFVHGVMNTDNMSIHGLTIDYGPYGWLEGYEPDWTPNTTDAQNRRYRFENQPAIALWNLAQLGNALYPLTEDIDPLQNSIEQFKTTYTKLSNEMKASKLGLPGFDKNHDRVLFDELEKVLQLTETDMTLFYRKLADLKIDSTLDDTKTSQEIIKPLLEAYYLPEEVSNKTEDQIARWVKQYAQRIKTTGLTDSSRKQAMNKVNPKYVLRNYISQLVIDQSESGDDSLLNEILEVMRHPYEEQPEKEKFAEKRPEWARHKAGCSMLSCSS